MRKKKKKAAHIDSDILAFLASGARSRLLAPLLDPYAIMLEKMIAKRRPTSTSDPLLKLHHLHCRALRSSQDMQPIDAETAIQLAGEIRLAPPGWALKIFKTVREAKIQDKSVDLNQRLGFTAQGKGHTSEAERRAQENIADQSRLHIWGLSLLGYKIGEACWMEAGRLQRMPRWNTTTYFLGHDLGSKKTIPDAREAELYEKRLKVTERLRQDFFTWRTKIEKDPMSPRSRYYLEQLTETREKFLAQFPTD